MTNIGQQTDKQVQARQALQNLKPYAPGKPIWEVQKEYGLDRVIKLASNENSLGPSPKALEAIRSRLGELHRYPDGRSAALVHALAEQAGLTSDNFVVTNGGDELIVLISQAFLEPGDEIVVPEPTFSEYAFGANLMEGAIIKVPLREGFRYGVDDLLAAVTDRTKIVYLCSPNNPTGTYLPEAEMRRFLDLLPKRVLVVIDVAYWHYATADDYCDGYSFIREEYPVIALHTFSKIYGLAGIRVGYGAAPASIIATLLKVKTPFNVNALAEAAALAALDDEAHVDASRRMNEEGREQLYAGFRKLSLSYTESMANFVLVEIGPETDRVYQQLLERGIIVRAAKNWGFPRHVRVSVGTREENAAFLEALEQLL